MNFGVTTKIFVHKLDTQTDLILDFGSTTQSFTATLARSAASRRTTALQASRRHDYGINLTLNAQISLVTSLSMAKAPPVRIWRHQHSLDARSQATLTQGWNTLKVPTLCCPLLLPSSRRPAAVTAFAATATAAWARTCWLASLIPAKDLMTARSCMSAASPLPPTGW